MKWSIYNLEELKKWLASFSEEDEIKIPDFLALIAIERYQKILKIKQGRLHNGHFTDDAVEEAIKSLAFHD